jgi:alcohol dehydrogenase (cytochrome c)/quinohemoprotein ethanol dehydrogenase
MGQFKTLARVIGATMVAAMMMSCSPADDKADTGKRIINADAEPQNWLSHGRTYGEGRFSPLTNIKDSNVKELGLAWSYDLDTDRGQEATPLAVDGVLYTTSAWSKVQAFDAITGKLLWQFDPQVPRATGVKACCDVVNRGAAYWNGKVYVGTIDGRLIAVDAKTGQQVWSAQTLDDAAQYNTITGAPRIIKGRVIIGNGGAEMGVRGYVTAYDAETGKQAWRFYTVPGNPAVKDGAVSDAIHEKLTAQTWSGTWWEKKTGGGGGGTVWDSMAYDPDLDLLYIGVGNSSHWNKRVRSPGDGDNLFVSSIVALKPETGEYVWHFQEVPGDSWDYTATQHMILADLTIDGQLRKVLMQAPKNGFFYLIDRATGKFISGKPYIPLTWAKGLDPVTGRPDIVPEARYWERPGQTWEAMPGSLGGHNWQPMSFNPQTGLVYIPTFEMTGFYMDEQNFKSMPVGYNVGIDFGAMAASFGEQKQDAKADHPPPEPKAYLQAWDPVQQKEVWRVKRPYYWNGGTLSTAGNLVFQGDEDGIFKAFDAKTGAELWSFDGGSAITAAPITYSVNGMQYVTVVVGFGGSIMGAGKMAWTADGPRRNKSRVLTFALGGKATLPAREVVKDAAPPPAPEQFADAATLKTAANNYYRICVACHGFDATSAGIVPDIRHSGLLGDKDAWYEVVGNGALAERGMVAFKADFTPEEIEGLRAYVISRARAEQNLP